MTNIEAMKLALEALCQLHFAATELDKKNRVRWFDKAVDEAIEAIAALRQAISEAEQAEQEPVACDELDEKAFARIKRHFAAPPKAEQEPECNCKNPFNECQMNESCRVFRAIDDAAPPKVEQEPVAWLWTNDSGGERLEWESIEVESIWKSTPLYTAPPQREWVSLTDDEILGVVYKDYGKPMSPTDIARAIEAKLKEKNS